MKLSIVMPVFNEGINLKFILKILKATIEIPHETLVVYDTLNDDSIPVIEFLRKEDPTLKGVHNQLGRGVANAIKAGVKEAKGDYVLILAADDVGPILTVDEMISLMDKGCDLVSATRYAYGGKVFGGAPMSRILSRTANKLFYFLSGSPLTDSTVGIKMVRRDIVDRLDLSSQRVGWAIAFEIAIKAQLLGFKLGEVPIVSINRFYGGKSSFKLGSWVMDYSKLFLKGMKEIYFSGKSNEVALKIPEKLTVDRKK